MEIEDFADERNEQERFRKERQQKIAAMEGLAELKAAYRELKDWEIKFGKTFDDIKGPGIRPHIDAPYGYKKVTVGSGKDTYHTLEIIPEEAEIVRIIFHLHYIESMLEQYPVAAAFLKAEEQSQKENDELAIIGSKALERIINEPEKYAEIIDEMDRELVAIEEQIIVSTLN